MESLIWTRATAAISERDAPVEYTKVRVVVRPDSARIFDNNGALLAQGTPTGMTRSRSSAIVTFADGSTWTVERARGCGCGS